MCFLCGNTGGPACCQHTCLTEDSASCWLLNFPSFILLFSHQFPLSAGSCSALVSFLGLSQLGRLDLLWSRKPLLELLSGSSSGRRLLAVNAALRTVFLRGALALLLSSVTSVRLHKAQLFLPSCQVSALIRVTLPCQFQIPFSSVTKGFEVTLQVGRNTGRAGCSSRSSLGRSIKLRPFVGGLLRET